ncbi:MAG: hypothetical protein K6E97_08615 [Treponema sp.]|nr:hypothetical protein [Treponema sp.]
MKKITKKLLTVFAAAFLVLSFSSCDLFNWVKDLTAFEFYSDVDVTSEEDVPNVTAALARVSLCASYTLKRNDGSNMYDIYTGVCIRNKDTLTVTDVKLISGERAIAEQNNVENVDYASFPSYDGTLTIVLNDKKGTAKVTLTGKGTKTLRIQDTTGIEAWNKSFEYE